jgi:hypothetical protein
MFNWFKKNDSGSNVIPFPEPKETPKTPYIAPPEPQPEPKVYYTFGLTDDNRVTFTMGYTTLTMNDVGIQDLIDQLEFFKKRIE